MIRIFCSEYEFHLQVLSCIHKENPLYEHYSQCLKTLIFFLNDTQGEENVDSKKKYCWIDVQHSGIKYSPFVREGWCKLFYIYFIGMHSYQKQVCLKKMIQCFWLITLHLTFQSRFSIEEKGKIWISLALDHYYRFWIVLGHFWFNCDFIESCLVWNFSQKWWKVNALIISL